VHLHGTLVAYLSIEVADRDRALDPVARDAAVTHEDRKRWQTTTDDD
jgi:hypothetical protein